MSELPKQASKDDVPQSFQIHASVVFQLGESLITDAIQALTELVKNSYDADATYCSVSVSTGEKEDDPFKGAVGVISGQENGKGMSVRELRGGWLTISK